jgi:hypothetical protein
VRAEVDSSVESRAGKCSGATGVSIENKFVSESADDDACIGAAVSRSVPQRGQTRINGLSVIPQPEQKICSLAIINLI